MINDKFDPTLALALENERRNLLILVQAMRGRYGRLGRSPEFAEGHAQALADIEQLIVERGEAAGRAQSGSIDELHNPKCDRRGQNCALCAKGS